jgi:hypothetical protein
MKSSNRAQHYRKTCAEFRAELPADLTTPERALLEMAAMLSIRTDEMRDAMIAGAEVAAERLADVANAFCAAVESLGLTIENT